MFSILYSWRENLYLLKLSHIKTFIQLTLKTLKGMYSAMMHSPLFLGVFALYCFLLFREVMTYSFSMRTILIFLLFCWLIIWIFVFARPSVLPKSSLLDVRQSLLRLPLYVVLMSLTGLIVNRLSVHVNTYAAIEIFLILPYISYWLLFSLDARFSFKDQLNAFRQAGLFLIYNLPITMVLALYFALCLAIISGLWTIIVVLFHKQIPLLFNWNFWFSWISLILFFIPSVAALASRYYARRIHDQFDVYCFKKICRS